MKNTTSQIKKNLMKPSILEECNFYPEKSRENDLSQDKEWFVGIILSFERLFYRKKFECSCLRSGIQKSNNQIYRMVCYLSNAPLQINTGYSLLISYKFHGNVILQVNRVIDVTHSDIGFPPWVWQHCKLFRNKKK